MVRIMKLEEQKLDSKQKEEDQKKQLEKLQLKEQQQQHSSGILGKFRSFWRRSSTNTNNNNNLNTNNNTCGASQSVMQNKNGGLVAPSNGARGQSKSVGVIQKSGRYLYCCIVVFLLFVDAMCSLKCIDAVLLL